MKILVLNGSPRKKGTVATLLREIERGLASYGTHDIEWIDVNDLSMKFCTACMVCREKDYCILPEDDAHRVGQKIRDADALVIGTPVHWGNMSAPLKLLFDRNVPVFMGESARGMPQPRQKGKKAVIVTACTSPWPFNFIFAESRGAIRAVKEILHYGGYTVIGTLVNPGTKGQKEVPEKLRLKARKIGKQLGRS